MDGITCTQKIQANLDLKLEASLSLFYSNSGETNFLEPGKESKQGELQINYES